MGPTFIKIGQLFSTRTDILPVEVTEELSRLQDRVPAFSSQQAVGILERELGMSVAQAFRSFEYQPIAAASLGQVSLSSSNTPCELQVLLKYWQSACSTAKSCTAIEENAKHSAGLTTCQRASFLMGSCEREQTSTKLLELSVAGSLLSCHKRINPSVMAASCTP